jgi:hypothetical protein
MSGESQTDTSIEAAKPMSLADHAAETVCIKFQGPAGASLWASDSHQLSSFASREPSHSGSIVVLIDAGGCVGKSEFLATVELDGRQFPSGKRSRI